MPNSSNSGNSYYIGPEKEPIAKMVFRKVFKSGFNLIQFFVILMTVLVFMYLFVLSPHVVDGRSMQPNFCNHDIYFTFKLGGSFKRDTVIAFKHDEANDYIKRIIGLPGDTIRVESGRVYRNGELLNEIYLPESRMTFLNPGDGLLEGVEYTVPEEKFFVMGDNRSHSTDSRYFLAIDPKDANPIDGKVVFVVWPPSRARIFDHQSVKPENECLGTFPGEE
jgi:signal peptidase I